MHLLVSNDLQLLSKYMNAKVTEWAGIDINPL